jgi:hypothetical protein
VILTDEELLRRNRDKEQHAQGSRHAAQERKRRMLEKEIQVRARREQTAMEMELDAQRKALLTNDDILQNQHLISIRKVNSLALQANGYMACDSLREHQKERAGMEAKYNRLHDQIMAKERVDELTQRKEDEAIARAKRIEARQMLEQQIADRQRKQMYEEESKAIEAQKILATYKQFELEEQKKLERHREQVRETVKKVGETNDRIREMKDQMIRQEKQDEMVAAAYLRKKAAEEDAKLQEQQRISKAKELRIAKLRAQQEKAQDKRAAQDEFRAKKAWEAAEMNARIKQQHEKEARITLMQTISEDRKRQEAFRIEQTQQTKQMESHLDRLTQQRADEEDHRQRAKVEATKEHMRDHGLRLREQIEQNNQMRVKAKMFEQNDTKYGKMKAMREAIIADKYRHETLATLEKRGVAEEYLRELKRMDINPTNA